MVLPKGKKSTTSSTVIKTSSTSQFIVIAVKVLFVLLILFLLPKLVDGKRKKTPPKRTAVEARKLRLHCEQNVCGAYLMEENLNCVSMCLSPACYEKVYGDNPVEDGELDFVRAKLFDECFLEESFKARQRQRAKK